MQKTYDPFVIPFAVGFIFILIAFIVKLIKWTKALSHNEKIKIIKGFFSINFFLAIKEIILESLLHRKIFKQNTILGFMHASIAFGWFMLILIGNLESRIYSGTEINPFWIPIFFDFFVHDKTGIPFYNIYAFLMDFFLLIVLTGILLANLKRFFPSLFKMKKTTKLRLGDKLALYSLWLIFPFRLFAESFTAGINKSGGFITGTIGQYAASVFDLTLPAYISWWIYSLALGIFFFTLPFSRYLHIPAEVILILYRKFGINSYNQLNGFAKLEIDSCSRCGICIDKCQINFVTENTEVVPSYFLRNLRYSYPNENQTFSCLLCGRCEESCPVGININNIRLSVRNKINNYDNTFNYSYLPDIKVNKAKVAYFAGCMTHLTPKIIISMQNIFTKASIDWVFIDKNGGACCGRPLKLSGNFIAAEKLISFTKNLIINSEAEILVTSCPICLKVFKEDYNLNITILHHSQFINKLINENKLKISESQKFNSLIYHSPCELGRGLNIYEEPYKVVNSIGNIKKTSFELNNSLCCGGSLSNTQMHDKQRDKITLDVINKLNLSDQDKIITACPLCKKTFSRFTDNEVIDIAEAVNKVTV